MMINLTDLWTICFQMTMLSSTKNHRIYLRNTTEVQKKSKSKMVIKAPNKIKITKEKKLVLINWNSIVIMMLSKIICKVKYPIDLISI